MTAGFRHTTFLLSLIVSIGTTGVDRATFPLDSVLARAQAGLSITWIPDSANTRPHWYLANGSKCGGADTVYRRCDFEAGREYRGIAYSYGGEDPHHIFASKLTDGFLAGSHQCHYETFGDPTPVIAGTDCSGFVCHAWNFPRTSTEGLVADRSLIPIAKSQLVPGDILVKPHSHTVLVVEREDSTRLLIWEATSTVNGCRERIVDLRDTYWDYYVALRNSQIIAAPASARSWRISSEAPFAQARVAAGRLQLDFAAPFSGSIQVRALNGTTQHEMQVRQTTRSVLPTPAFPPGVLLIDVSAEGHTKHVSTLLVTH